MADATSTAAQTANPTNTAAMEGTSANSQIVQQYLPKQNNGQWVAMGSMVGTIAGMLYDSGTLDSAKDAEKTWRTLTDDIMNAGVNELTTHAAALTTCNDTLWQKLCDFASTGYCPDYQFVLNTAVATARASLETQLRSLRINSQRYNVGQNADVQTRLRSAQMMAIVSSVVSANEKNRQFAWTANWDMLHTAARDVEEARLRRIELGGALVAGAGQNYANLAQSLRQTAAMDVGDLATLGAMLGVILPILIAFGCDPKIGCE